MTQATQTRDGIKARMQAVDDHIRFESSHDLESLVGTFGDNAEWHNKPSGDILHGHDAIRGFYRDLFDGFPDFWLDIHHRRVADDAVVVDGVFGGTHKGPWMGIPATGKKVAIPFCAVFTFTDQDRLQSEIAYYDRLTLLEQLGVTDRPS